MKRMRAATYDSYGGPEVLRETMVDFPVPRGNEVLVRVRAMSINGYDILVRSGGMKMFTGRSFPKRTGLDFVGEIVTSADDGAQFRIGDRVWGVMPLHRLGSAAEFVPVAPADLSHGPEGLESIDAAALPVVGATAIMALRDILQVQRSERLLVRGASGGVGSVAVQLGRAMGAHVTGLSSAANVDFVRELGADASFDYAETRPADLPAFDAILDAVGSNAGAWRRRLTRTGRMAAIVPDPAHPLRSMAGFALSRIHGSRRIRFFSAKPDTKLLSDLAGYVDSGTIRPIVDGVYPLARIGDAHRAMETGRRRGKQVVSLT